MRKKSIFIIFIILIISITFIKWLTETVFSNKIKYDKNKISIKDKIYFSSRSISTKLTPLKALSTYKTSTRPSTGLRILFNSTNKYGQIFVYDFNGLRCLTFQKNPFENKAWPICDQSVMKIRNPQELIFAYAKRIISLVLLMNHNPGHILIMGIGGGTLAKAFQYLYQNSYIDLVDINLNIVKVSQAYFNLNVNSKMRIYTEDGILFVKKYYRKSYDMIILDAFNNDYIPESMMTYEFLNGIKRMLKPSGIVFANSFIETNYTQLENYLFNKVFGIFSFYQADGNRIILTSRNFLKKNNYNFNDSRLLFKKFEIFKISEKFFNETLSMLDQNLNSEMKF